MPIEPQNRDSENSKCVQVMASLGEVQRRKTIKQRKARHRTDRMCAAGCEVDLHCKIVQNQQDRKELAIVSASFFFSLCCTYGLGQ